MDPEIRRKKHFGQHFLANPATAERIAAFLQWDGAVVEIGPGAGILTAFLLGRKRRVTVVERDSDLIPFLEKRFGDAIQIIRGDALDLMASPPESWGQIGVVSNLPYNIASPLTFLFCKQVKRIPEMVLMFQREVAEKIVSCPGPLNLAVAPFFEVRPVMLLKPASFNPPPKVDSTVLHFTRRRTLQVQPEDRYFRFCRRVFENRRKMLYKNIMKNHRDKRAEVFRSLEIPQSVRVDQLSVRQLLCLYREVNKHGISL